MPDYVLKLTDNIMQSKCLSLTTDLCSIFQIFLLGCIKSILRNQKRHQFISKIAWISSFKHIASFRLLYKAMSTDSITDNHNITPLNSFIYSYPPRFYSARSNKYIYL